MKLSSGGIGPGRYSVRLGVSPMAKCEICGKGPMHGHNVSHSMRHTKRKWQPNVQKRKVFIDGEYKKIYICTRCLRTLTKKSMA